jgi:uncharacterized protein (TIGR02147 family)
VDTDFFYRRYLKSELASRCERNSRYSIRAFASFLGTDIGALSRVLAGKQVPSIKLAEKMISKFELDPNEERDFLLSLADAQRARHTQGGRIAMRKLENRAQPRELSMEFYRAISEWYHAAILELTFTAEFKSDFRWISQELGITQVEAKLAVERLLYLGLLREEKGQWIKTEEQLRSADKHLTSPAHRRNQRQFLEKAIQSLESDPIESRNITSMTMAIDPDRLAKAGKLIQEFHENLCAFLEGGKQRRVYNLEIALYPLQKGRNNHAIQE